MKHNIREILIFAILLLFFAGLYGFLPGVQLPSLGIWYGTLGTAQSLAGQPFTHWLKSDDLLLPYGSPVIQGFWILWMIAFLIKVFSIPGDIAGNIVGMFFLGVTLYTFVRLMLYMGCRKWIGYLCGCLFLLMPFIRRHLEFGSMGIGFMLVPLGILADLIVVRSFFESETSSKTEHAMLIAKVLGIRLLLAGVDWYSAVISMVGGAVIIVYYCIAYIFKQRTIAQSLRAGILWGLTWIAGVLPWYLVLPKSNLSEPFSLDFFRAQGVDLISLVVPRGYYLWGTLVGLPKKWPAFEFYGDGTNVDYNYLGLTLIVALGVIIYLLVKNKIQRTVIASLVIAGAVCLLFSLGPSLKINSRHQSDKQDLNELTYQDYQMPADNAVMSLPTSFLYKLFPVSYMRATYRWVLFPKIILLLVFGWLINYLLYIQRSGWAITLSCLAILEFFPQYAILARGTVRHYKDYKATSASLLDALQSKISPGERILILSNPTDGDYLASWIVPNLGVTSFNGAGDKNNWLATPHMPEVIKRLKRYDVRTDNEIKELVLLAIRSEVVDKIVIPYFSARWDSYDWPPDSADVEQARQRFGFLKDLKKDSVIMASSMYFSVLSSNVTRSTTAPGVAEQLDSVVQFISTLPESTMFLVDGAKAPLTSLFSGRGEFFFDYRQFEFVDPALKRNRPVVFVLTGYQKHFDKENYDRLQKMLAKRILFHTTDYGLYTISPFVYNYLNPSFVMTEQDCLTLTQLFNEGSDSSEVSGWSPIVDFSNGEFQQQLCRGWFPVERVEKRGYRWIGPTSTLFLTVPHSTPKELVVSVYPPLNQFPHPVQNLYIYLNGYSLGYRTFTKQDPFDLHFPIGDDIRLTGSVAMVTLRVDRTILPTDRDKRELGLIVSKVGFK